MGRIVNFHEIVERKAATTIDELRRVNADEQTHAILEQRDKEERIQLTRLKAAESRGIDQHTHAGFF